MCQFPNPPLLVEFDARVRLLFAGATITSDAGLLALREFDDAPGLTALASRFLLDSRTGSNLRHQLVALLRRSVFGKPAGDDDTNDADRLAEAPALRVVSSRDASEHRAAGARTPGRFETDTLTPEENLSGLSDLNAKWVERGLEHTPRNRVILDLDSSVSPVHGHQERASDSGHSETVCSHPPFLFNHSGDLEASELRPGHVASADGREKVLKLVFERHTSRGVRVLFHCDAAFARPEIYDHLEAEQVGYAIRIPANDVLMRAIEHRLKRPAGRPPEEPIVRYESFKYQASSWGRARRVVAKVERHAGELFPRVGFIVTKRTLPPEGVVHFYHGRGACEQWIQEGRQAPNWTRPSGDEFASNTARPALFAPAYNPGNLFRRLGLPKALSGRSLTGIQTKLIKTGAGLARHARRLVFQPAGGIAARAQDSQMLRKIRALADAGWRT